MNNEIITGNTFELLVNLKTENEVDQVRFTFSDYNCSSIFYEKQLQGNADNSYLITLSQQDTTKFKCSSVCFTAKVLFKSMGNWQSVGSTDKEPITFKVIKGRCQEII